jgi:predicted RNA binding protein YcfA (HicA-like mRNA interferase family)
VSKWPSSKARRVLKALYSIGWTDLRCVGSHHTLSRPGRQNYVFSFHDNEEIGPKMLARIAKQTGLRPEDL